MGIDRAKILRQISANTPDELRHRLMKTVIDDSLEESVMGIINDHKTPYKTQEKLRRLLATGAFRREDTVVDEEVAREMDRYNEVMIEKMKKQGILDDPMNDKYFRERFYKRMKYIKKK